MFLKHHSVAESKPVWFILGLLLLVNVEPAWAEDFARFMTTAKERRHLDQLRETQAVPFDGDEAAAESRAAAESTKVYAGTITARGLVYRGRGKSTAWINKANSYADDAAANHIIFGEGIQPDGMSIALPGRAGRTRLKVGQTFDLETERLKDMMGHVPVPILKSQKDSEHLPVAE